MWANQQVWLPIDFQEELSGLVEVPEIKCMQTSVSLFECQIAPQSETTDWTETCDMKLPNNHTVKAFDSDDVNVLQNTCNNLYYHQDGSYQTPLTNVMILLWCQM